MAKTIKMNATFPVGSEVGELIRQHNALIDVIEGAVTLADIQAKIADGTIQKINVPLLYGRILRSEY